MKKIPQKLLSIVIMSKILLDYIAEKNNVT